MDWDCERKSSILTECSDAVLQRMPPKEETRRGISGSNITVELSTLHKKYSRTILSKKQTRHDIPLGVSKRVLDSKQSDTISNHHTLNSHEKKNVDLNYIRPSGMIRDARQSHPTSSSVHELIQEDGAQTTYDRKKEIQWVKLQRQCQMSSRWKQGRDNSKNKLGNSSSKNHAKIVEKQIYGPGNKASKTWYKISATIQLPRE